MSECVRALRACACVRAMRTSDDGSWWRPDRTKCKRKSRDGHKSVSHLLYIGDFVKRLLNSLIDSQNSTKMLPIENTPLLTHATHPAMAFLFEGITNVNIAYENGFILDFLFSTVRSILNSGGARCFPQPEQPSNNVAISIAITITSLAVVM